MNVKKYEDRFEVLYTYSKEYSYLADTHTAVALAAAEKYKGEGAMVVLSTANPYKFPRVVLDALGEAAPESDFDAIHQLELLSEIPACCYPDEYAQRGRFQ